MISILDLGPLEQAVLRAVVLAESIDAPLSRASIWRTLPGYRTALPNVRAALATGAPLRSFLLEAKDRFVLQDRAPVLRGMAERQGRADALWRDLKRKMRGLCKLPWVEAVGIGGHMAWGVLEDGAPIDLVVIAEGGRVPLARAAVRTWRKATRTEQVIRLAAVLDADDLELALDDLHAAWWLLAVRPVSNEDAFHRLWQANQEAGAFFPNFDSEVTGGLPEYLLADRVDGRLARLRRSLVAQDDDGVLLRSAGRAQRPGEERLQRVVAQRPVARACREWIDEHGVADVLRGLDLDDPQAAFAVRWRDVASWTFGVEEQPVPAVPSVDPPPVEPAFSEGPPATPMIPSTRRRGPGSVRASGARARRARTSPASPESGQRPPR